MKTGKIILLLILLLVLIGSASAFLQREAESLYQKAEEYKKNNENMSAIKEYSRVVKKFPESEYAPAAQYSIAQIYFYRLKDYPRAKREYKKVVGNYPSSKWTPDAITKIEKCEKRIKQTQPSIDSQKGKPKYPALAKLRNKVMVIVGRAKSVSKQNPKILVLISIGIVGLLLGYWLWRLKIGKGESEHSALSFMSSGGEARIDPSKPFSSSSDFQRGGVKLKLGKEEISPFSRRAFGIGPGKPFSFDGVTIRVHACSSVESYRERKQWCNESNKGKDAFTCCFCHETVNLLPPELNSHRMDTCPNCGREIALYVFENNPEYNKTLRLRGGAPDFAPVSSGVIWTAVPKSHAQFKRFMQMSQT